MSRILAVLLCGLFLCLGTAAAAPHYTRSQKKIIKAQNKAVKKMKRAQRQAFRKPKHRKHASAVTH